MKKRIKRLLVLTGVCIYLTGCTGNNKTTERLVEETVADSSTTTSEESAADSSTTTSYETYANRYSVDNKVFISKETDFYANMELATVDTVIAVENEDESPEAVRKIWDERIKNVADNIKSGNVSKETQEKLDEVLIAWEKYDEEIILLDKGLYGTNGIVPGSMYKDMLTDHVMTEYEMIGGAFLSWEYELLGANSMKLNVLSEGSDLSNVHWSDFSDKSVVMEYDSDFEAMLGEYDPESADTEDYYSFSKELCSQLDEKTDSELGYEQYVDDYYTLICSMANLEKSISDDETAEYIKTIRMKVLFLKLLNAKFLMNIGQDNYGAILEDKIKAQLSRDLTDCKTDISYSEIDCGNDGKKEILATVSYDHDGVYHEVFCVLSQDYRLEFSIDSAGTDEVAIDEKGMVETSRNVQANVRNYEFGYLDCEGNYNFKYGKNYYLTASAFEKLEGIDESWNDVQIEEYYFTEDDSSKEYKYCIFKLYENFEKVDDEVLYDPTGKYCKAFNDAGLELISLKEIEEKINV
ncbi:hypothetical protein D6853_06070 [Butyrivibrio sp. X503]|uniref:hypothetical protein n=1 Tax=Butyrivibrio sp. X503 TaxID=2364878 RepID=UPI000EA853B6|nr:hypothetical protein [Butyrivibrio sp. X503]RKM56356.1 hypothetical protein D6853_06070 [Butyrivibrio sp. X503]